MDIAITARIPAAWVEADRRRKEERTMKVKLLSKSSSAGLVLQDAFASEEAVRVELAKRITFTPKVGIPGEFTVSLDGTYTVQDMEIRSELLESLKALAGGSGTVGGVVRKQYTGSHEYPHTVVSVQSKSDPNLFHGVAVDSSGVAYACTCKAFEHHNDKACKHMTNAQWSWIGNGYDYRNGVAAPMVVRIEPELLALGGARPSFEKSFSHRYR